MAKQVIVINEEGEVQKKYLPVSPRNKQFNEDLLQRLIFREPKLLPTEEIDSDFENLIPLGREISVKSGSIDVLYLTPEGKICIVETKLWRNSQAHREVVAQIIDYAKDLSVMTFRTFCEILMKNRIKGEESEKAFFTKIRKDLPDLNEIRLQQDIQDSLSHGRFMLLIVGDEIFPQVALMVDSIQSAPHLEFNIALAELRFYTIGDKEANQFLVVPQVVEKKTPQIRNVIRIIYEKEKPEIKVTSIEPEISMLDKDTFLSTLDDDGRRVFKEILRLYETQGFPIHYGTKGFSLNVNVEGKDVAFLLGYGSKAFGGQSLSIIFTSITSKIKKGHKIANFFRQQLRDMRIFRETKTSMIYKFKKKLTETQISELIKTLIELANQIELYGLVKENRSD